MASSMVAISRRLCRILIPSRQISISFCTTLSSPETSGSDDSTVEFDHDTSSSPASSSSQRESNQQQQNYDRPLENGMDVGIYKAILVGQVGQSPIQKRLRSGRMVTLLSVGTGGIRNNRRPFHDEEPKDYANRCSVQWHRVSIYPERLGSVVMKNVLPGSILYLEGNLETKVFTDQITGLVRRIREVAIRQNGRVVSLGKDGNSPEASQRVLKGVGYF